MKELKKIDFKKSSFEANGQKYKIHKSLSIGRYKVHEKLAYRLYFGSDPDSVHTNVGKAINLINEGKTVAGYALLNNIYESPFSKIEDRYTDALKMCALYISRVDEDLAVYNEELNNEKIKDWELEGIDQDDFFAYALHLLEGYIQKYQDYSQIGTKKKSKK